MSNRQFRTTLAVFLFLATMAAAAFANPVEARFAGLGGENQNGEYTYPYFVTIDNGPQIAMMCDDFYHQSNVGDTWQANITALSSGDLGNTRFDDLLKYQEAGYLLMQITDENQAEWGNINFAVWQIFNPGVNAGDPPPGTLGAAYWLNLAQTAQLSSVDFDSVMILTPLDAHTESGVQEFLFLTPEPGTLALIGGGILGLFSQRKRLIS
jgi:hypothetical protein